MEFSEGLKMEITRLKAELLKEQVMRKIGFDSVEAEEIAINYVHEFNCWRGRYWERNYSPVVEE